MEIDVTRLGEDGARFEGEADIIGLDEEFVKPFGGVRYSLFAQVFGGELVVKGTLEQDFDLVCSRCGRDFDTTVKVEDYFYSAELPPDSDTVDLTADARECIILALPAYPDCGEECPGPGSAGREESPADDRWSALDGLKVVN